MPDETFAKEIWITIENPESNENYTTIDIEVYACFVKQGDMNHIFYLHLGGGHQNKLLLVTLPTLPFLLSIIESDHDKGFAL